jgi:hypothetical protein
MNKTGPSTGEPEGQATWKGRSGIQLNMSIKAAPSSHLEMGSLCQPSAEGPSFKQVSRDAGLAGHLLPLLRAYLCSRIEISWERKGGV